MSITTSVKGSILKSALTSLTKSNDTKTTILGLIASGVLVAGIDFSKLFQGDAGEIGKLVGAVVAVVFGYYTNKPHAPSPAPPTA